MRTYIVFNRFSSVELFSGSEEECIAFTGNNDYIILPECMVDDYFESLLYVFECAYE